MAGAALGVVPEDGVAWVLLDGTVQVLGLHTDPRGRCEVPGLPPGTVGFTARYGSRTATVLGDAGMGVEITLPQVR